MRAMVQRLVQETIQAEFDQFNEMYVHGVSTRKVSKIVEQLCGHLISASTSAQRRRVKKPRAVAASRHEGSQSGAEPG